jgi:aminopeptidase N
MNNIDIWKEFEKKSKSTQKQIKSKIKHLMKQAGFAQPNDDKVMWEIVQRYNDWAQD